MNMREQTDTHRTARAEAAAWLARLHGPSRTPAVEAAFRQWLNENPENATQFEYLTGLWDLSTALPVAGTARISPWKFPGEAPRRRATVRPRYLAIAAGFLLLATASIFVYQQYVSGYSTDVGEQRILTLDDGTRISLNTDTALRVKLTDTLRLVQLKQGEALFSVAKDPNRPFLVTAGNRTITALGTSFLIRTDHKKTAITLIDGKIAVTTDAKYLPPSRTTRLSRSSVEGPGVKPAKPRTEEQIVLTPGQRLTISSSRKAPTGEAESGEATTIDTPRIDTITAWRRGEVVLERTTMADAIDEMNRYDETQLVIDSPQIENLQISGIYQTGDSRRFAQTIAQLYDLQLTQTGNQLRLAQKLNH